MLHEGPVFLSRLVNDDYLAQLLDDALSSRETLYFFDSFQYRSTDHLTTLVLGQSLLNKIKRLRPEAFERLHKGAIYYWLARAAFFSADFETAAFFIDAAVSEDLRTEPSNHHTPALLFITVDDGSSGQASLDLVKKVRSEFDEAILCLNSRKGAAPSPLTLDELRETLLRRALKQGNEAERTIATTLISYLLETQHRRQLISFRPRNGSAEPFFLNLVKGCLLFESLLKTNPLKILKSDTLGKALDELWRDFGFNDARESIKCHQFDEVLNTLSTSDGSVKSAIIITGKVRNILSHNLGIPNSLDTHNYRRLSECVTSACLHSIACLYRPPASSL